MMHALATDYAATSVPILDDGRCRFCGVEFDLFGTASRALATAHALEYHADELRDHLEGCE